MPFVIAPNSCFTYKGRAVDMKQVGRELGVRYVLEGSLRTASNWIRVTAQLDASARQNSGGPSPVLGLRADRKSATDAAPPSVIGGPGSDFTRGGPSANKPRRP
jgi:hypothetical protein